MSIRNQFGRCFTWVLKDQQIGWFLIKPIEIASLKGKITKDVSVHSRKVYLAFNFVTYIRNRRLIGVLYYRFLPVKFAEQFGKLFFISICGENVPWWKRSSDLFPLLSQFCFCVFFNTHTKKLVSFACNTSAISRY